MRTKRSFLYYLSTVKGDRNPADRFVSVWSNLIFLYQKFDYSKCMVVWQVKKQRKERTPSTGFSPPTGCMGCSFETSTAATTHICVHQMLSSSHHPYQGVHPNTSNARLLTSVYIRCFHRRLSPQDPWSTKQSPMRYDRARFLMNQFHLGWRHCRRWKTSDSPIPWNQILINLQVIYFYMKK